MKATTQSTAPVGVQPLEVTFVLENADDIRWMYHLMNFHEKEIVEGYNASSKGGFYGRFQSFELPDKKDVFRAVKAHAADNGVVL